MIPLARYVRHAELYGFDADFFAIAAGDLVVEDLGRLSLRLQNIDPKWTLPQSVRRALALKLAARGVDPKTICRMAMISRWTLNRALNDVVQVPETAPQAAFQGGALGAIQATPSAGTYGADLSHSGVAR